MLPLAQLVKDSPAHARRSFPHSIASVRAVAATRSTDAITVAVVGCSLPPAWCGLGPPVPWRSRRLQDPMISLMIDAPPFPWPVHLLCSTLPEVLPGARSSRRRSPSPGWWRASWTARGTSGPAVRGLPQLAPSARAPGTPHRSAPLIAGGRSPRQRQRSAAALDEGRRVGGPARAGWGGWGADGWGGWGTLPPGR